MYFVVRWYLFFYFHTSSALQLNEKATWHRTKSLQDSGRQRRKDAAPSSRRQTTSDRSRTRRRHVASPPRSSRRGASPSKASAAPRTRSMASSNRGRAKGADSQGRGSRRHFGMGCIRFTWNDARVEDSREHPQYRSKV